MSSSKWAMLNQVVTQGIRILVSIYLMRLINPDSFGVFMKALAIVGVSETLVGLRLGGGIVQQKVVNQEELSTVFWVNCLWTIFLASIFYFSSTPISLFYNDERVTDLMQWSSLVVLIMGIGYVPRSVLTKSLDFKKIFQANLAAVLISSILGIYLAHAGFDYWSLFFLWASFNIVLSLNYFILSKYRPLALLKIRSIKKIWGFSSKLLLNDILNYTARNIDNIIVGRVLGSYALGIYSRAYNIMLLPVQNFVNVINGVLFPSFSLIQNDKERVRQIFSKAVSSILLLTIPAMLFVWIFATELTLLVFGNEWIELGPLLKILLMLGMIQIQSSFAGSVFLSMGRSDLPLKVSYVSKPILLLTIFLTVGTGITALAIGITIVSGLFSLIQLGLALRLINYNFYKFTVNVSPVWLINIGLVVIYYLGREFVFNHIDISHLLIMFFITVIVNVLIFEMTKPVFYNELKAIFRDQLSQK